MNRKQMLSAVLVMLLAPLFAWPQGADRPPEERQWGGFTVHQSIEFGGRIAEISGNELMYNTYTNLHSGPRLLGQELSMEASPGAGTLFDRLYVNSFGFGGDPENLARIRVAKSKLYNFVALYRRDKNFFDYNLFANPLNANQGANVWVPFVNNTTYTGTATTNSNFNPQAVPWFTSSPHRQDITRNMGDFGLTLLPQSAISVRLGYARNNSDGRTDTTAGQPFVTLLTQQAISRSDRYQVGVDVKLLPETTLSGDFFFEHDKNDFDFRDNNRSLRLGSATGLPVDVGLQFFPIYATSSTNPVCTPQPAISAPGVLVLSPTCTGAVLDFFKRGNVRTDVSTGQLSLVSNIVPNLDITASGTYSSATSDFRNFAEFNYGLSPQLLRGPARNERISTGADLGLTYHLSKSWSVSDRFRWYNWRQPGALELATFTCSHASGSNLLSPFLNPCGQAQAFSFITAVNSGASLSGNASSGNFLTVARSGTFLGERSYYNTAKLSWEPGRLLRAYIGYRYGRRELKAGTGGTNRVLSVTTTTTNVCQLSGNPSACATTGNPNVSDIEVHKINQHTGLLGIVVRPVNAWRINADLELLSADGAFTHITSLHQQRVRAYTTVKVRRWASLSGGVHFIESRNGYGPGEIATEGAGEGLPLFQTPFAPGLYGHKDHWRSYSIGLSLTPNGKTTFDVGWTLLEQGIKAATCMPLPTDAFPFTNPITLGAPAALNCRSSSAVTGSTNWSTSFARAVLLDYDETTNTAYVNTSFSPFKRATFNLGYEITGDNGRTNWLRGDTGQNLQVVGDVFGNVPYIASNLVGGPNAVARGVTACPVHASPISVPTATGTGTACLFAGPFPDQPLGPQALNWHKASAGVAYELTEQLTFKGVWSYYDYNAKDRGPEVTPPTGFLRVAAPRSFHANIGTISLKYSF